MSVAWNYTTGRPNIVFGDLKRSIAQLANNNSYFKIGITSNPNRRWGEHKKSDPGWDRMIVVYETTSLTYIRQLESLLIEAGWNREESWNFTGGGGGRFSQSGKYYLYILYELRSSDFGSLQR
jgi:hypothetical protein